jgi:uncharacterized integral membrane protein (TIGR00697 family)
MQTKINDNARLKYFHIIIMFYVTILLVSNIVAQKLVVVAGFIFPAALFVFPLSYIFDDVLTEVYGYSKSRIVIWTGLLCNMIAVVLFELMILLPSSNYWHQQQAFTDILGSVPRIVIAAVISIAFGQFCNAYVLAKLKVRMSGKHLWLRMIASTAIGVFVDSVLFITIAFSGAVPISVLATMIVIQYFVKVLYEVILTPLSCHIVKWLKKTEKVDVYDTKTNFNPFKLSLND